MKLIYLLFLHILPTISAERESVQAQSTVLPAVTDWIHFFDINKKKSLINLAAQKVAQNLSKLSYDQLMQLPGDLQELVAGNWLMSNAVKTVEFDHTNFHTADDSAIPASFIGLIQTNNHITIITDMSPPLLSCLANYQLNQNCKATYTKIFDRKPWEKVFISPNGGFMAIDAQSQIRVKSEKWKIINCSIKPNHPNPTRICFSYDDEIIMLCSDKVLELRNRRDGRFINEIADLPYTITAACFSPIDNKIAVAFNSKYIRFFTPDGSYISIFTKASNNIRAMNFSSDGKLLAIACENGFIELYDIDGNCILMLHDTHYTYDHIYFIDHDKILTATKNCVIKVWHLSLLTSSFEEIIKYDN